MISTTKLRQKFINYFKNNNHKYAMPSPVVIDDPSLLFVNAGMNQFKKIFLGESPLDMNNARPVNIQPCIRAGGKHNDLDDVGNDSWHLSLFEMAGNWSLNDYWKEDAIGYAINFLINECGLNLDNIYVTYFEGNDEILQDVESHNIWTKYVPENKIIKGSYKDNFWSMAEVGPCGVSTEIHYDLVGNRDASQLVNKDDPSVIEIWRQIQLMKN